MKKVDKVKAVQSKLYAAQRIVGSVKNLRVAKGMSRATLAEMCKMLDDAESKRDGRIYT